MGHFALENQLSQAWPPPDWQDLTILLAVSGGADSIALVRAFARLKSSGKGRICVAHYNHRLRGPASEDDERFVAGLCDRLGMYCVLGRADSTPHANISEEAARAARYEFLRLTAEHLGARFVVTAHTADDQAETILHHVLRGTGLAGLAGISRARPLGPAVTLIRPMLGIRRADVLEYLAQIEQPFRTDATNHDIKFTRNRIRHELFPRLEREFNPSVRESLLRLGSLAADAGRVIQAAAADLLGRVLVHRTPNEIEIDCAPLTGQERHLVREMLVLAWREQAWPLQSMGFDQWNQLADFAQVSSKSASPLRQMFPGGIMAQRRAERLTLTAQPAPPTRVASQAWSACESK